MPEQDVHIPDVAQLAAYNLGRSLKALPSWQTVLWRISLTPERPWSLDDPNRIFVRSFDESPGDFVSMIRESVQALALHDLLNGAALVELHRLIDVLAADCEEMINLVAINDREGIVELFWSSAPDCDLAFQFAELCVKHSRSLDYFRLGCSVANLLHWGCNFADVETAQVTIHEIIKHTETIGLDQEQVGLQVIHDRLSEMLNRADEVDSSLRREVVSSALKFEEGLRSAYVDAADLKPIIEVVDTAELIFICGERVPFSEFSDPKARVGLRLFLALAKHPEKFLSTTEIQAATGIRREHEGIKEYVSACRAVIRNCVGTSLLEESVRALPERYQQAARHAFIVNRRRPRETKGDPSYTLALPPSLVEYRT